MQSAPTLISSTSEELALRDTQVDEYYTDISPENTEAADQALSDNPYPGLRPFNTTESIVFFGREGISSEIITRLAACRFLAVLGSSGTGKSSIIRAGLLPVLETLPGKNGNWKIAICRPGKNPFGNLARAISAAEIASPNTALDIWKVLSSSSFGYRQLYGSLDASVKFNTLIVIDQFEELFRYRRDYGISGSNDAALFVKMLIETSQNENLNTYVIITMRSEYLGDCVKLPQLVDAINNGQYLVPRLKSTQLLDVITEPTSFNCVGVEEGYASKLIGEVGDSMDQLPVLQHVLRRAYQTAKKNAADAGDFKVGYRDYVAVGKMESALDVHANEVYNNLTSKQQLYCRIMFQSITDLTTDGRGIRRPLPFVSILNICRENEVNNPDDTVIRRDLEVVVNAFRENNVNFLMPPPHVALADETEIDISHESLMRIWERLKKWMEEEAKDAALLDQLLKRDMEERDYFKGGKLVYYNEWLKRKKPGLSWALLYKKNDPSEDNYQQKFIDAKSFVNKSKKAQIIRRLILIALISVIVLMSIAGAAWTRKKNDELQQRAEQLNSSNETIQHNLAELEKKNAKLKEDSIHINVVLAKERADLQQANKQLSTAEQDLREKNKELTAGKISLEEKAIALSIESSEKQEALKQAQDANQQLEISRLSLQKAYDSASLLRNLALSIKHAEKSLAILPIDVQRENVKAHLALVAYQKYQQSGDEETKKLLPQVYSALYSALASKTGNDTFNVLPLRKGKDNLADAVMASIPADRYNGYLAAEDKMLYSFDFAAKTAMPLDKLQAVKKVVGVEASLDGQWIAINTLSKNLLLVNNATKLETPLKLSGIVRTFKFSVDHSMLYVYTQDSVLTSINVASKQTLSKKVNFKLEDIAVSKSHIYGLTTTGNVVKWDIRNRDLSTPETILPASKEATFRGTVISCTPDNSLVVWGNENGKVFYAGGQLDKANYLTRFSGPITEIAFNASLSLLAVGSYDKKIQVYNFSNLQSEVPLNLVNDEGPVTSLFFLKDTAGKDKLMAVISPGTIREYPMDVETLACRLYALYKDKPPTDEEWAKYFDNALGMKKVDLICK